MQELLGHYDFYDQLRNRQFELETQLKKRKESNKKTPNGLLTVHNRGNYNDYYIRKKGDKNGRYISKTNTKLIKSLAQKKYDSKFIKEAEKELNIINKFVKEYSDKIPNICNEFGLALKSQIDVADISDKEYVEYWNSIPYTPKGFYDDVPLHMTAKGERVRSKSEEIIANTLNRLNIPYKYECPLILNTGDIRYPDFTILDIKNRKEYYYEHFGMMDDTYYLETFIKKMKLYESSGILPGINLIMTFEASDQPINTQYIEQIIKQYICL